MSNRLTILRAREYLTVHPLPTEETRQILFAASVHGHAQAVVFVTPASGGEKTRSGPALPG